MPYRVVGMALALALSLLLTSPPADAQWERIPTITVSAVDRDPRIPLAVEAINFWNQQLADIGTPFRLGAATHTIEKIPTSYLERLSAAVLKREPRPDLPHTVTQMPGDIIIAMSDGDFISFATRFQSGEQVKAVVGSEPHLLSAESAQRRAQCHCA